MKDIKCGDLIYGRNTYDYQKGTLVFIVPGQVVGKDDTREVFKMQGWGLCFHPDLLRGTPLSQNMKDYSFFSYEANESLHMSECEKQTIINSLQEIREELLHSLRHPFSFWRKVPEREIRTEKDRLNIQHSANS